MLHELKLRNLAIRIEWHWLFILPGRKKMRKLFDAGFALSSKEMLRLNERLNHHCVRVMLLTEQYKHLSELNYFDMEGKKVCAGW